MGVVGDLPQSRADKRSARDITFFRVVGIAWKTPEVVAIAINNVK